MTRRDIAHFVADGKPGGGTTVVLALVDALCATARWNVTVIGQPDSYLAAEVRARGLTFIGIDLFRSPFDVTPPWFLAWKLGSRRFAVTHVHGVRAAHHALRTPLRERLGRLVYTVHGLHQLYLSPWLRALANFAERRVMHGVDERVFVAAFDLSAARSWGLLPDGVRAEVVANGVDVQALGDQQVEVRQLDVLFVGRHTAQKQPEQAARVLARLAHMGWRCAMAGGGDSAAVVRSTLGTQPGGRRVVHYGELMHRQALELLGSSRVVIAPSRWEGLPVLPMEAMALGVVPVVSRIPGHAEVLEHGVSGLLVDDNDGAFVDAAVAVLTSATLECQLRAGGKLRVAAAFDRSAMVARYLELYNKWFYG